MRIRSACYTAVLAAVLVVGSASAAGAQQLVDSAHNGGRAFIGMCIMIFAFVAFLFAFDKVRQRKEDEDQHR
jgi:hypothetical protein